MITPAKLKLFQDLVASLNREQLIWLNGYLEATIQKAGGAVAEEPAAAAASGKKITIAYGTESGNSKRLASSFGARARQQGIQAKVVSLDQYRLNDLPREEYFFAVISTQGEGEPPAAAKKFYDHIHQNGFQLPKMKYGVLALGDTAYPQFCKAGEDVDAQLKHLGGERIVDIRRCDVDYETDAVAWFNDVLSKLDGASARPAPVPVEKKPAGRKIFEGRVITNVNLNDRGSLKETHHLEIGAEGVDYKPGDSIGIVPHNPKHVVEAIVRLTGIDGDRSVEHRGQPVSTFDLLHKKLNISYLPERVITRYAGALERDIPANRTSLLNLLEKYPFPNEKSFEDFIQHLEPNTPRLYSIASSLEASPDEVHLTVGRDSFSVDGEEGVGLCSSNLCALQPGDTFDFYVHHNNQFRLPAPETDIILVGPGTGIAPFRAFLAEREATGATGRSWLFFGEQHFQSDFLYQTELQQWLETGVLTRLDVAFSRDQLQKIYVQHKIKKQRHEVFEWIEKGAGFYICGAKRMSDDVESTLLEIFTEFKKGVTAEEYLDQLKESGRFLKDVY